MPCFALSSIDFSFPTTQGSSRGSVFRAWVSRRSERCLVIEVGILEGGEEELVVLLFWALKERFISRRKRKVARKKLVTYQASRSLYPLQPLARAQRPFLSTAPTPFPSDRRFSSKASVVPQNRRISTYFDFRRLQAQYLTRRFALTPSTLSFLFFSCFALAGS